MSTEEHASRAVARARVAAVVVLFGLALVVAFALGRLTGRPRPAGLPDLGKAPRYTLTNQLGQPVSASRFRGKVQLVSFLFPYCTTYCPLIAAHLVRFEDLLEQTGLADRVQLVSFDVDPENTGPEQMRAFLREYGWNPQDLRWEFLVGPPAELRRVVTGGFAIEYRRVAGADSAAPSPGAPPPVANPLAEEAKPDYDVTHNDALLVVGPQGRIRRIFDQADRIPDQQLLSVVQALARGER
jgi:protein SCO1/2